MPPLIARDIVQRLVAREQATAGAADPATVAERAARRLGHELVGWFGPFATQTLVSRALTHARAEHPALDGVRVGAAASPFLEQVADSARVHGADATAAGVVDVVVWAIELLGRLIGDELAMALVQQSLRRGGVDAPHLNGRPDEPAAGEATDGSAAGGGTRDTRDTTGTTTDD